MLVWTVTWKPEHRVARLLSGRDRLSRSEKDDIFEEIALSVAPARRRLGVRGAVGSLVAVVALVLIFWAKSDNDDANAPGGFAARGQGGPHATLALVCTGEADGCVTGNTLAFDLAGTRDYKFFAAFAKGPEGEVVWYFPDASNKGGVSLSEALEAGILNRGVVLGAEHPPGRYRVYGIFSMEPLTRAQIRDRFRDGVTDLGEETAVVSKELLVP